jgi:K+-transporting ATPase ATPase C chain
MSMNSLGTEIRTSVLAVTVLAVVLCGLYPLTVWVAGRALFPNKADGSLIVEGETVIGSELIGQAFTATRYFHPRPSAAGAGYDAAASAGSNLGPLSKTLQTEVGLQIAAYRTENGLAENIPVPSDAVTASASGLDPHISPQNAWLQAPRIARERGLDIAEIGKLIAAHTQGRDFGFLGEPRVNVLLLNMALDGVAHGRR